MQREITHDVRTGLDRLREKARSEKRLQFSSLAHHINADTVLRELQKLPSRTGAGVDGLSRDEAVNEFQRKGEAIIASIYRKSYKAPPVRRVYIPKPGKTEKRPIGVPTAIDRAVQKATSNVLSAIYEQDFLPCSFGGRPGRSCHHAIATVRHLHTAGDYRWAFETDLKNFFGTLDHGWVLRFLQHRVKDPRMIELVSRWLKAGVLEDGQHHQPEEGTPQGGSISVLLSNVYMHYVLDLWFEHRVKKELRYKCHLVRYLDDFIVLFEQKSDAIQFQRLLEERLQKFNLQMEPSKTRFVRFGRFSRMDAKGSGERIHPITFLGFAMYTDGVGARTQLRVRTLSDRFRRGLHRIKERLHQIRHCSLRIQSQYLASALRGHFNYFGVVSNSRQLQRYYYLCIIHWRRILSKRSQSGYVSWAKMQAILSSNPLPRPRVRLFHKDLEALIVL